MITLRGHFGRRRLLLFVGSRQRKMVLVEHGSRWASFNRLIGARTGSEPSGSHWDHRGQSVGNRQRPGRYANTGRTRWLVTLCCVAGQNNDAPYQEEPNLHLDFYPQGVPGGMRTFSKLFVHVHSFPGDYRSCERHSGTQRSLLMDWNSIHPTWFRCRSLSISPEPCLFRTRGVSSAH